jgi:hypothetical protein
MKKHLSAVILGAALAVPALALAAPGDDLADKYFSKNNPTLTAQEKAAIAIAKKWNAGAGIQPVAGPMARSSSCMARSSPASFARCCKCAMWPCRPASK